MKTSQQQNVPAPAVMDYWKQQLKTSLRARFKTDSGLPPKHGDRGKFIVEFDPAVERKMDSVLGRKWGSMVYKQAFAESKPKADAWFKWFDDSQIATNRRYFKSCLARAAVYCSKETLDLLSRPLNHVV